MIRLLSTVSLAGLLALGLASPPAQAAGTTSESGTNAGSPGMSGSNGSSSSSGMSSQGSMQNGSSGKVTKQHTGEGDTGYGDRAPGIIPNENGPGGGGAQPHR